MWFGRQYFRKYARTLFITFSLFLFLFYFLGIWSSLFAAFVRAPWGKEDESGPAISAPSDYSRYIWEWEVGPKGVDE
jgi:hypothetical protein